MTASSPRRPTLRPRRHAADADAISRRGYSRPMAIATPYTEKTDEQKAICEMVRQFADEQILPNAEHYDHEDSFPEPIVEQMKELGLFGVTIPEEYGGMGLDLTTYAMIVEELSRGLDLDLGDRQHALHRLLPADEVRHRGAEADVPAAHGHRRDPRRILAVGARVRVRRPGDQDQRQEGRRHDYEINGQKMWVTNGLLSTLVFVLVRTDPAAEPKYKGHDLLHRREGAGRHREHRRLRRLQRPARRSRSSATRASSRPSSCSTATAARPTTSSAARRPASARGSCR